MMTYILMRFYEGGGLADYKIVKCDNEDDLYDKCVEFEEDCVRRNVGTRIGILDLEEFKKIENKIKHGKKRIYGL